MNRRTRAFLLVSSLTVLGVAATAGGIAVAAGRQSPADRIVPGVFVAGIDLGGLTREEATDKVRAWARERMAAAVVLTHPRTQKKWSCTVGELAGRFQTDDAVRDALRVGQDENLFTRLFRGSNPRNVRIEPRFVYAGDKLDARLAQIGNDVRRKPRNARAHLDKSGALVLAAREEVGAELDAAATRQALLADGPDSLADGAEATLVLKEEAPAVTAADLGKLGTLLGAYSTDYSSSSDNRKHNVGLAASHIDGTLLGPGQEFSYNQSVGPREAELGWRMAHQYQDGQVVDGIGGGVCQVSSTLYNAALLAGLKIVERHNHSMPVAYLRAGRDATVTYGYLDFRFANSTPGPIFIAARADGNRLHFKVFGTAPQSPRQISVVTSDRTYTKTGGFTVAAWRVYKNPDGTVVKEPLGTNYYRPPAPPKTKVAAKPKPRPKASPPAAKPGIQAPTLAPATAAPAPSAAPPALR